MKPFNIRSIFTRNLSSLRRMLLLLPSDCATCSDVQQYYGNEIITRESPIICKLQFRSHFIFVENQEPGKVSHIRRYRINPYQNNYAFSVACKTLNWGSMFVASLHPPFNMLEKIPRDKRLNYFTCWWSFSIDWRFKMCEKNIFNSRSKIWRISLK